MRGYYLSPGFSSLLIWYQMILAWTWTSHSTRGNGKTLGIKQIKISNANINIDSAILMQMFVFHPEWLACSQVCMYLIICVLSSKSLCHNQRVWIMMTKVDFNHKYLCWWKAPKNIYVFWLPRIFSEKNVKIVWSFVRSLTPSKISQTVLSDSPWSIIIRLEQD